MVRVYLCDDHQLMLDGLDLILESHPELMVIGRGYNGQELIDWLQSNDVDVVLLDINMPVLDGIKTSKILREQYPDVKVVFLSMVNQLEIVSSIHTTGARGFLLKNSDRDEVIQAILKVDKGGSHFSPEVLQGIKTKAKRIPTQYFPKLTSREKEVLKLIINEYTSPDIAEKLFISVGTVDTHRRNLISKLGVKNTAGLVRIAIEYQLV